MKKGDIFIARNRQNHPHPIVYWECIEENARFRACILSTTSTNGNVLMNPNHFCDGFIVDNTHLVISPSKSLKRFQEQQIRNKIDL